MHEVLCLLHRSGPPASLPARLNILPQAPRYAILGRKVLDMRPTF